MTKCSEELRRLSQNVEINFNQITNTTAAIPITFTTTTTTTTTSSTTTTTTTTTTAAATTTNIITSSTAKYFSTLFLEFVLHSYETNKSTDAVV